MTDQFSPAQLAILRLLHSQSAQTKQEIAQSLQLSLPTITTHLRILEQAGIIVRADLRPSTGGRKAVTYQFNTQYCAAIGVTIRSTEIVCIAVNLAGEVIDEKHTTMAARAEEVFYQRAAHEINDFAHTLEEQNVYLLGIGMTVPTHINAASSLHYQQIGDRLAMPVTYTERYCAYAIAECWNRPQLQDAVCLFLGKHIGSAIIVSGVPHTGAIEHMQLVPNGPRCECGSFGCLNVYCSSSQLAEEGESLPGFFGVLEQGEIHHRERMQQWLQSLAYAIANIQTILSSSVILCGPIASYLDSDEITQLQALSSVRPMAAQRTEQYALLPHKATAPISSRVILGLCDQYQEATGAALAIVQSQLASLGCN